MIDPVDLDKFFIAFFSAAMIILMGACYALFFTLHKLFKKRVYFPLAYVCYGLLTVSVALLSDALHLNNYWQIVVWVMLFGYLLAPHGIWHLCRGTHIGEHGDNEGNQSLPNKMSNNGI